MPAYNTNPPQLRNLGVPKKKIDFAKARARQAQQSSSSGLALSIPKQEPESVKQGFLSRFHQFMSKDRTPEARQVFGNIRNDYRQGGQDIIDSITSAGRGEQSPLSASLQTVGTVAKTAFSPITRPLEPLLMGAANKLAENKTFQKVASTDFVGERLGDISFGVESYKDWAKQNPELSKNIEATTNIALLLEGEKPAQQALKTAAESTTSGVNATLRGAARVSETVGKGKTAIESLPTVGKDLIGKGRDLIKPPKDTAGIVGEITQAKDARGLARSQKALTELDTTGVTTYEELLSRIQTGVKDLSKQVDDVMARDATLYKPKDLTVVAKTEGGQIVQTDYVSKALRHLEEIYTKSGDDLLAANIKEAIAKYVSQGLSKLDINDLSRVYGLTAPKGFSKLGESLTSFSAQASENIRSGLKNVARQGMDDTAKNLDAQIGNLKTAEGYTLKMVEAVQNLSNKIEQRGLLEQVGRFLGNIADLTTGGFVKSFFSKFLVPSNVGQKVMNSLDLESRLAKNLQLLKKVDDASDKQLLDIVRQLVEPADDAAKTKAPVTQFEAPKIETRSSLERSPIITYIKNNPPNLGLSIRDVKAIDSLTKKEMVEIIDYARLKQPYNQSLEDAMAYLAEKYNLKGKTPIQIANELEDLLVKTKTKNVEKNIAKTYNRQNRAYNDAQDKLSEVRKANEAYKPARIKPDPLTAEARKYKSAEEFVNSFNLMKSGEVTSIGQLPIEKVNKTQVKAITERGLPHTDTRLKAKDFSPGRKITQPLEVYSKGGSYVVENGNHRLAQAIANGDTHIPVVFKRGEGKNYTTYTKSQLTNIWNKANKK